MTEYFPLEPRGIGTSEVEALPSFICRLAGLHGTTLASFLKHLRVWWENSGHSPPLTAQPLYQRGGGMFCGYGPGVKRYVEALGLATGRTTLARMTFLDLASAGAKQGIGLARHTRAWCPACFLEHHDHGEPCYERLLWSIPAVKRCPIHRVALCEACPACSAPQRFYHKSGVVGICWSCGSQLLVPDFLWTIDPLPAPGERDCIELVSAISNNKLVVQPKAFQIFYAELFREIAPRQRLRFGQEVFGLTMDNANVLSKRAPQFISMLRSAEALRVNLVDVLAEPLLMARVAGGLLPPRIDKRSTRKARISAEIRERAAARIKEELDKSMGEPMLPLYELAREIGLSLGALRYYFGTQFDAYRKKRVEQKSSRRAADSVRMQAVLMRKLLPTFPSAQHPTQESLAVALTSLCSTGRRAARIEVERVLAGIQFQDMPRMGRKPSYARRPRQT